MTVRFLTILNEKLSKTKLTQGFLMKKRSIKKVAVIGSGIMGSGIACHFANIGVQVLLLDIIPRELTEVEKSKGLTLENKIVRNRIVNDSLKASLKSKPSPIYNQKFADRITTGNLAMLQRIQVMKATMFCGKKIGKKKVELEKLLGYRKIITRFNHLD